MSNARKCFVVEIAPASSFRELRITGPLGYQRAMLGLTPDRTEQEVRNYLAVDLGVEPGDFDVEVVQANAEASDAEFNAYVAQLSAEAREMTRNQAMDEFRSAALRVRGSLVAAAYAFWRDLEANQAEAVDVARAEGVVVACAMSCAGVELIGKDLQAPPVAQMTRRAGELLSYAAAQYYMATGCEGEPAAAIILCPRCYKTSRHPDDVANSYCPHCHMFHEHMEL